MRGYTIGSDTKADRTNMMEAVYFTVTAVALYFASDWILNRIEISAGRRFERRSLIFFAILLFLSLLSFTLINKLVP